MPGNSSQPLCETISFTLTGAPQPGQLPEVPSLAMPQ
jgi:hypothetical protein